MNQRYWALLGVLCAASLWGVSGTVAQLLFQHEGFQAPWLVTVRLMASGSLLLLWCVPRFGMKTVFSLWHRPKDRLDLVLFSVFGMLGVQYTFFSAVAEGNAAMATILQYLGPVFIMLYVALRTWRIPGRLELIALSLSVGGIFLLVTGGRMDHLTVSAAGLLWGLGAALTTAFYTLFPVRMLSQWNSLLLVGWAMLIGGLLLALVTQPWQILGVSGGPHWSLETGGWLLFIILFGTLLPFYLYLDSLRHLRPLETSLMASAEPLSAAIVSIAWLHTAFGLPQWLGSFAILGAIMLLSLPTGSPEKSSLPTVVLK